MSHEPLLLPSAKAGVIVHQKQISPWWRVGVITIGLLVVCVGAADAASRFGEKVLGNNLNLFAFAPVALVTDPSLLEAVTNHTSFAEEATPLVPVHIRVPSIDVNAAVEAVGKKANGAMATPARLADVAWYSLGSKPGAKGNAVFAGHVNNAVGFPGVFSRLSELEVGDPIIVEGSHGERLQYEVVHTAVYPADQAPKEEIFKTTGTSQLVLITCEGEWDTVARTYDERLVVVARLASL